MSNLTPAKMVMFVFVAIGMLITFYLVKTLTAKEPPPRVSMRSVPLTLSELKPGTVITAGHIGIGPAPANQVVGDVLLTIDGIVGRVVKNEIPVTEFIRGSDLYPIGQHPPLVTRDGFTAITVPVEETASINEGLFRPDEHVDIYYTPKDSAQDPRYKEIGAMTIKLFEGVRVVAINNAFVQRDLQASNNSVTLEIRDKDSALLHLAQNTGKLSFGASNYQNARATVDVADSLRPTLEELMNLPEIPEEPEPPEPDRFTTNVWRRGTHSTRRFLNGIPADAGDFAAGTPQLGSNNTIRPGTGPGLYPGSSYPGGPNAGINPAPNGLWNPGLTPQPGSFPAAPPPGQERLLAPR